MLSTARTRRAVTVALASALFTALSACASAPPPPPPTEVVLAISADDTINPDPTGRPSPAQVHIYWLRGATDFESADFFDLTGDPSATLGAELASHEVMTVRPSSQQSLMRRVDPGVSHVGIVTAYRSLDGVVWRAVTAVPPNARSGVGVTLVQGGVSLGAAVPTAMSERQTAPTSALAAR
ncbi:type VI secretion system lipoprotein TssJ [Roseospira marina]|uniref:Type VI secretion system lipoprotein TssJ n=1 Tax=Roseospira marina TaxID=140057 RepID=A0A5M6IFK4_9PROT|nr:type VI secretion system lipoprotein TssJ [Roseospira marina]KAA5606912.1 type VI secretion system lipoprotein TssJ [Roseospira marina]MBB4312917.1 type VI secretion system protein VasD [Roseospira marina]MBB5086310.1 type VI secretion system protein VasD [Roseospira marina]